MNKSRARVWLIVAILVIIIGAVAGAMVYWKIINNKQSAQAADPRFVNDKDRDGISNAEEQKQGTSETEFDTDHDGLSDQAELNFYGTDPVKADTDGDGYPDGYEVAGGYNPSGAN